MRVLADHCVPENLLEVMRGEGHEILRVVDLVDPRARDRDVAVLALRNGAVLLTVDTDFQRRRDFEPRRFGGIILLKDLPNARERVLRRLLRLIAGRHEKDLSGTLTILDRRSARVHR